MQNLIFVFCLFGRLNDKNKIQKIYRMYVRLTTDCGEKKIIKKYKYIKKFGEFCPFFVFFLSYALD